MTPETGVERLAPSRWAFIIAIAVLTVCTWLAGTRIAQYETVRMLAFDGGFSTAGWITRGAPANVDVGADELRLSRNVPEKSYLLYPVQLTRLHGIEPRDQDRLLRIRARVQTREAPSPEVSGRSARLMLFLHDDLENRPIVYRNVAFLGGKLEEQTIDAVMRIDPRAAAFYLVYMNEDSDGEFVLVDARIELVTPRASFRRIGVGLLAAWTALAAIAGIHLVRQAGWLSTAIVGAPLLAIVIGVGLPESGGSLPLLNAAIDQLQNRLESIGISGRIDVFKLGHFLFFVLAVLTASLMRARFAVSLPQITLLFGLLAIATETGQLFLTQRTPRLSDLAIDVAGIGAGLVLSLFATVAVNRLTRPVNRIAEAAADPPP